MATIPVPVNQAGPASATAPDRRRSLGTEIDQLFDRFLANFTGGPLLSSRFEFKGIPSPAADITEDDSTFKLSAELPGLTDKDIQISISGDTMTIAGKKEQEREEKQQNYHLTERSYGQFRRSFYIPDTVDREKINAQFANGVLNVIMPKSAKTTTKQIPVNAAA